jgi:hypothetical protein
VQLAPASTHIADACEGPCGLLICSHCYACWCSYDAPGPNMINLTPIYHPYSKMFSHHAIVCTTAGVVCLPDGHTSQRSILQNYALSSTSHTLHQAWEKRAKVDGRSERRATSDHHHQQTGMYKGACSTRTIEKGRRTGDNRRAGDESPRRCGLNQHTLIWTSLTSVGWINI